jgi:hypothetical protein
MSRYLNVWSTHDGEDDPKVSEEIVNLQVKMVTWVEAFILVHYANLQWSKQLLYKHTYTSSPNLKRSLIYPETSMPT